MRLISHLLPALVLTSLVACGDKDDDDEGGFDTGDTGAAGVDADGDGFEDGEDCDDADAAVNPDATEVCDGVDNNCDDQVDEGLLVTVYADADGDGFGDDAAMSEACEAGADQALVGGDCDDADAAVNPDADEVCDDLDNDCDGATDEDDATDASRWFADLDADGYGDATNSTLACDPPSGFVADNTDCDDGADTVHPGADEICDGADSDCDGTIGEVRVPTDHATLEAALDAGEPRVCLQAGTHTGNLVTTLTQDTTIEGVGAGVAVLSGGSAGTTLGVMLDGNSLTVSGLTILAGLSAEEPAAGLYVMDESALGSVEVSDTVLTGNECSGGCLGTALSVLYVDSVVLQDVEVYGNASQDSSGVVAVYGAATAELDGVHIHDETVLADGEGFALSLLVAGLYEGTTVSLNDVLVEDNAMAGEGEVYGNVTVTQAASVDATNVTVRSNDMDVDWCVSPGFFAWRVLDGTYRNIDIRDNRCHAVEQAYAGGFWHFSEDELGTVDVENMVVAGNEVEVDFGLYSGWIMDVYGTSTYTNVTVTGNTATGGYPEAPSGEALEGGGWAAFDGADVTLTNVDVSGNSLSFVEGDAHDFVQTEVESGDPGAFAFSHSNLYDATFGTGITDPVGADGNISADPAYTDVTAADAIDWDLSLQAGSALIDAGDAGILDPDGTTSDIGAHGGPGAADW